MANEITVTASLTGFKASVMAAAVSRALTGLMFNMTSNFYVEGVVTAGLSATVIPLGAVTTPHWSFFYNRDITNYVTIRNGASGADLIQLYPGEPCWVPLLQTSTPYVLANTATCLVEYLIFGY